MNKNDLKNTIKNKFLLLQLSKIESEKDIIDLLIKNIHLLTDDEIDTMSEFPYFADNMPFEECDDIVKSDNYISA